MTHWPSTVKDRPIDVKKGYVYILGNHNRTTLYIGVTSNIERRILEHKAGVGSVFTSKYQLTDLLYVEHVPTIEAAIQREKQLKNWHRNWKMNLIKQDVGNRLTALGIPDLVNWFRKAFSLLLIGQQLDNRSPKVARGTAVFSNLTSWHSAITNVNLCNLVLRVYYVISCFVSPDPAVERGGISAQFSANA